MKVANAEKELILDENEQLNEDDETKPLLFRNDEEQLIEEDETEEDFVRHGIDERLEEMERVYVSLTTGEVSAKRQNELEAILLTL